MKKYQAVFALFGLLLISSALLLVSCRSSEASEEIKPESETACPTEGDGETAFSNPNHGYCLLYPEGYTAEQPNPSETALVIGSLMNHTEPRVSITVEAVNGRSADQVVDEMVADLDLEAFGIERTTVTLGGEQATLLDNMSGQDLNRQLLTVHGDFLYHLYFSPFDPSVAERQGRMEALYDAVTGSFVFQEPTG